MKPRIGEIRRSRGITQTHIAKKLGVTQQLVSRWEKGESTPDVIQGYKLAKLLFVDINDLYEGE